MWNLSDIYEICVAIPDPLTDKLYAAVKAALERHATTQYEVTIIILINLWIKLKK